MCPHSLLFILYQCLNGTDQNKVLGSSASHAAFVFLGDRAPCLLDSLGPTKGRWVATPPRWEVLALVAAGRLWLAGFPLGPDWALPRPHCARIGLGSGPPAHSRHGVSTPALLRAGLGHRCG